MKRNYKLAYTLIKELGYVDKEHAVFQWTAGRTTSMREMTDAEFCDMLDGLKGLKGGIAQRRAVEAEGALRKARSTALKQLQIYGINTADWAAINRFVEQPRIAGKAFASLAIDELKALTSKMRAIQNKKRRKDQEEGSKQLDECLKREAWSKQNTPS